MSKNRRELLIKMSALINRYGGIDGFVEHQEDWPRTIRRLVYSSEELLIHFGLASRWPRRENHD